MTHATMTYDAAFTCKNCGHNQRRNVPTGMRKSDWQNSGAICERCHCKLSGFTIKTDENAS